MVTKLGKVVKYHENLPLIKLIDLSINSLVTWFCNVAWHWTLHISTYATPMITNKHGRVMTHHEVMFSGDHKIIWPFKHVSTRVHVTKKASPLSQCLWRLTGIVTYCKKFHSAKLHDPSMKWSCEVTWEIKYIIWLPVKKPWTPN